MSDTPWLPPDQGSTHEQPPAATGAGFEAPRPGARSGDTPWLPAPPARPPGRRRPWGVIVALAAALAVVLLGVGATLVDLGGSSGERSDDEDLLEPIGPEGPPGEVPELPPSERGELPPTSLPAVVQDQDLTSEAARSGEAFEELTCEFTGTSRLARPLSFESSEGSPSNSMTLEPGARFDCTDGTEASAGTLGLDATFESLDAFAGLGAGTGRITWSELPDARRVPGELAPTSSTGVEVQLEFPVIVVWTTILDGPYAGYRGRLVLRDWEPLFDEDGNITGTRFATTSTTFRPG